MVDIAADSQNDSLVRSCASERRQILSFQNIVAVFFSKTGKRAEQD
jgi:hypothetical protein